MASTFATHGLEVVGVDVNPEVLERLENGELHIHEPGLRTLVQAALRSGNLVVNDRPREADAFIIAVPTPYDRDRKADLSFVVAASESIVPVLRKGNLVVLESTSPPRTTVDVVAPILENSGLKAGRDFYLSYTPERVLPGQILRELVECARVIGGIGRASAEAGRELYSIFVRGEIILTTATTAELVKLMENTYRDINIAIANEFSRLADRFQVDIGEAIKIANKHPRIDILRPGPGVGGHCVSVDPWFLVEAAPDITPLVRTAREVNDGQPRFVVELAGRALGGSLDGRRVAVLGLTYKADVDDMRESPSVSIAHLLMDEGAAVRAYEPNTKGTNVEGLVSTGFVKTESLEEAVGDAEMILLLVGHKAFRQLKPQELAALTPARLILDAACILDAQQWRDAGFRYYRLHVGEAG